MLQRCALTDLLFGVMYTSMTRDVMRKKSIEELINGIEREIIPTSARHEKNE